jgi:hypothetical protein
VEYTQFLSALLATFHFCLFPNSFTVAANVLLAESNRADWCSGNTLHFYWGGLGVDLCRDGAFQPLHENSALVLRLVPTTSFPFYHSSAMPSSDAILTWGTISTTNIP